ncbi:hypothetical protein D3C74_268710 [compost metagenome]
MSTNYLNSDTITKLLQLDEELKLKNNTALDHYLGIMVCREEGFMYDCTPEDALVFAYTGMGGDHFAFSTKNGTIHNLEEAPILFVQPMIFESQVKVVARNIKDLLSIFLSIKEFYILERFDWYESEIDMMLDIKENYEQSINERLQELDFISEKLEEYISIKRIENVFQYITSIRQDI